MEDAELGKEYSDNVLKLQNRIFIEAEKCLADKRPRAAISWLNKCNDKVRGQTKYIMRYTDALIALENYAGAWAKLDNLPKNKLKKKRNMKRIIVRKAICFHSLNQYARELECYDQIIKLNFKREKYYYHRGRLKARILEAAKLLEEVLQAEEQDIKYFDQLLECYRRMGDLVNETRTQVRVFELRKKHAEKYKQQGDAVYKLGKNTEAEKYYKQALILMPDTPSLLNRIACTYYWREEYPDAIDYLEKAVNKNPDYYKAHYNLGNCYLRSAQSNNERKMAEKYYLKACEIKPDFELAAKILRSMNTDDIEMVI